jgi:hypothetical protein
VIVWRLGHRKNTCDFTPHRLYQWHHRFDDPKRKYRTLYCANRAITCLRELLADLRPNTKAIAEFEELFSDLPEESLTIAGVVSAEWRRAHVLAKAEIQPRGVILVNVESPPEIKRQEKIHHELLQKHGITSLNIARLRSRQRVITQLISRTLYEEGHVGVQFRSRLDQLVCYALFEGRASLQLVDQAIPLTQYHPDLIRVCGEYTLVLRPGSS